MHLLKAFFIYTIAIFKRVADNIPPSPLKLLNTVQYHI